MSVRKGLSEECDLGNLLLMMTVFFVGRQWDLHPQYITELHHMPSKLQEGVLTISWLCKV